MGDKVVFAMDAIFGLPRKMSAGVSFRPPLYRDMYFLDQGKDGTRKSGVVKDVCKLVQH